MISDQRLWTSVLLAVLVSAAGALAQPVRRSAEAERRFLDAVELFRRAEYRAAAAAFGTLAESAPPHHRSTAAAVMRAKALLQMGENLEASRALREFLAAHPSSTYVPDAEYMLGVTYGRIRRYDEAVRSFLSAWRRVPPGDPAPLGANIAAALDLVIDRHRTLEDVRALLGRSTDARERAYLLLKCAELELVGGNALAASRLADSLDRSSPGHPYGARLAAIRSTSGRRASVKLGVLLPLMRSAEPSAVKQVGNDVHEGILQAHHEYAVEGSPPVQVALVTVDTDRDPRGAAAGVGTLADDPAVVGIIGPVFSPSTLAAAQAAAARGIPLVSPTANANGIAATGPAVFQANPDHENRGRAMALYAVRHRGFRTLAVLAPGEGHGRAMGEAFLSEALALGARVAATEWYPVGSTNLSPHLVAIRQAALRSATEPMLSFGGRLHQGDLAKLVQLGVPRRRLDSLVERSATVRATQLLGPRARVLIDSLGIRTLSAPAAPDTIERPATGIDAVYIPISSPAEIGVVTSQFVYYNIAAQVLGSGEWNDLGELAANRRYCEGVLFETDSAPDTADAAYRRFRESFAARTGAAPGPFTLYGYDTARLVLGLIGSGAATRDGLARALTRPSAFRGVHARIDLSRRRVNPWITIMEYRGDAVTRVAEIDAGEREGPP